MHFLSTRTSSLTAPPHELPALPETAPHKNPFVLAAMPLFTFISYLRHSTQAPEDLTQLRRQALEELQVFEQQMIDVQTEPRALLAARYCLAAALDEAVLATDWGVHSIWMQQPLLSLLFQETAGGERFYVILEQFAKEPRKNMEILELLYVLLSLGFEGKFYNQDSLVREEVRGRLFHRIRSLRGKVSKSLAPTPEENPWTNTLAPKNKKNRWWWCGALAIFVIVNLTLNHFIYVQAAPLYSAMDDLGKDDSAVLTYQHLESVKVHP